MLATCLAATATGTRASAAVQGVAAPSGGLHAIAVRVDLRGKAVHWRVCAAMPCAANASSVEIVGLDPTAMPSEKDVVVETIAVGSGRSVVHVRVPVAGGLAWEALLAARDAGPLVFSGLTGFSRGEEGERTGQVVQILPRDGGGSHVLVGDTREDLRICGQAETPLSPRALDPETLVLRGASVQRLRPEQRAAAKQIVASSRSTTASGALAKLVVAAGASTGAAAALTDGDPATAWSEARPGDGHGEFVTMRSPFEVPIDRLAITITPPVPAPNGAAPRTFFLVSDATTYAVTMPDDAWMHPGVAYEISFPEPLKSACLTVVLDEAYAHGNPRPDVTVAELVAYSGFDGPGASLDRVVEALSGGGARADAAAAVLKRAGDPALEAATRGYDKLDPAGRALAMDVAASAASCEGSAPLLVRALSDRDREVVRKGRGKLERCGKSAEKALIAALRSPDLRLRAAAAPLVGALASREAALALAEVMGQGSAETRQAVRGAFGRALRDVPASALAQLVAAKAEVEPRVDLLRAATGRLSEVAPAADAAFEGLFAEGAPMRSRYLLLGPLAVLARANDGPSGARLVAILAHDPDAAVRARAAEVAGGVALAEGALLLALADPEPRVREAAARTAGASHLGSASSALGARLADDPWTFVRAAAAGSLASLPPSGAVDGALAAALADASPRVRAAAIAGLSGHRAVTHADAVRARLDDKREDVEVRVSAARALGAMCVRAAAPRLAELAEMAASPLTDEASLQIALSALDALGHLHPADLDARTERLRAKDVREEVQRAASRARAEPDVCR